MASNQVQSSQRRMCTAVVQGVCGVVAIVCGITLLILDNTLAVPPHIWLPTGIANIGFGVWGGVIIAATAIIGCIYRDKANMISIYAASSLVSLVVAVVLFWVAIVGVIRYSQFGRSECDYAYLHVREYDDSVRCCFKLYECYSVKEESQTSSGPTYEYSDEVCGNEREAVNDRCREEMKAIKAPNLGVCTILLLVSVAEFAVSITAAVLSFIVVGCGCYREPVQHVVHHTYTTDSYPGYVVSGVTPQHMTGLTTSAMGAAYPSVLAVIQPAMSNPAAMTVIQPTVAPGYSRPLWRAGKQGSDQDPQVIAVMPPGTINGMAAQAYSCQATPPLHYDTVAGNI